MSKTNQTKLVNEENYTDKSVKSDVLFRYYTSYFDILVITDGMAGLLYN